MALSLSAFIIIVLTILFSVVNQCVGTYEYLSLTHQWQPAYCRTLNSGCTKIPMQDKLYIHGLWPSNQSDPQPRDCHTDTLGGYLDVNKMIPIALQANLNTSWPSLKGDNKNFWISQWLKHGRCYYDAAKKMQQKEYFLTAYNFWKGLNISKTLEEEGIVPVSGGGMRYNTADAIKAIKKHYTGDTVTYIPEFRCTKSLHSELYEIIMCLDHGGNNVINCTRTSSCGQSFLWKI